METTGIRARSLFIIVSTGALLQISMTRWMSEKRSFSSIGATSRERMLTWNLRIRVEMRARTPASFFTLSVTL